MSEDKGRELTWIWFKFIPKAICHCEWNRNLKVSLYCTAEGVKRLAYKISRLHCPGLDTRYSVSSYRYRFMGQVSGQEEDSNKCVNASEIYQCCYCRLNGEFLRAGYCWKAPHVPLWEHGEVWESTYTVARTAGDEPSQTRKPAGLVNVCLA